MEQGDEKKEQTYPFLLKSYSIDHYRLPVLAFF